MDKEKFFKNKKVTVMGVGLHGGALAVIKWLASKGAKVLATDIKSEAELGEAVIALKNLPNIELVLGKHRKIDFEQADLVIKNPTVSWDNRFIKMAIKKNIPIEMDSSLFFKFCASKKIIGVTGTKGKTTSSMMLVHTLNKIGEKVVSVGIGQESVLDKVDQIGPDDWVVFELSSWRLSSLKKLKISPPYALITNLYPDHLNYYKNFQDYIDDKKNIFLYQKKNGIICLNWDNSLSRKIEKEAKGRKIFLGTALTENQDSIFLKANLVYFCKNKSKSKKEYLEVFDSKKLKIYGKHNILNAMGVCGLLIKMGFEAKEVGKAIISFRGMKHRLDKLAIIDEVTFVNDTAATTPEATIAAINSFESPICLICGGSDKKLELDELAKKITDSAFVCGVFLLKGDATEKLEKSIKHYRGDVKIIGKYENLKEAVVSARSFVSKGSIILLSPGCASFGMFKNEFDRGDKFIQIINELKLLK